MTKQRTKKETSLKRDFGVATIIYSKNYEKP